jgi:AAT family amino acid transporter
MDKEAGLRRQLSSQQLAMIAIGGAIGTGLFLGSSLAVRLAGPAVILTFVLGAGITLLLMGALSEMAVAHPTAGSFGVHAEIYLGKWAGFVVRYTYWAVQAIAIGGEATAVAVYCRWWFPSVPSWLWIVGFSAGLLWVNARSVGSFGTFEYWFAMIKVVAIVLFIVFGAAVLLGVGRPAIGAHNYTAGGFFPHGWRGMWMALVFAIYGYIGAEIVAVTAGEAKDPQRAVPRAMRSMVGRLIIFYIGSMIVLIGVVPWQHIQPGADVTASPFVTVFQLMGIPAAAHVVNFVVLTAALSSINCNFYLVTRMMFSLARGGYAPAVFGNISRQGTPVNALMISTFGLALATAMAALYPRTAYVYMLGIALFGGLFIWLMIFITHLPFRRRWEQSGAPPLPVRMPGYPFTTLLGAASIVAILITTWWVEGMRVTLLAGIPWLGFVSLCYVVWRRATQRKEPGASRKAETSTAAELAP